MACWSPTRLPKERKMKAIGEKQVEVSPELVGVSDFWWDPNGSNKKITELLVESRYFSWWMYLILPKITTSGGRINGSIQFRWQNQHVLLVEKDLHEMCKSRKCPPPVGKILPVWLNLIQNPGWIGSCLKLGGSPNSSKLLVVFLWFWGTLMYTYC